MEKNFTLNTSRWNRSAERDSNCTMLRFRDFVNPGNNDKDLDFGKRLDEMIAGEAKGTVYLDLRNVRYLYAADIGKVVRAWRKLKEEGRRLILCNVEPFVCELFHITRVDNLIEIRRGVPHFSADVIEPLKRAWRSF
jgi:anti-anti-sigma factor